MPKIRTLLLCPCPSFRYLPHFRLIHSDLRINCKTPPDWIIVSALTVNTTLTHKFAFAALVILFQPTQQFTFIPDPY